MWHGVCACFCVNAFLCPQVHVFAMPRVTHTSVTHCWSCFNVNIMKDWWHRVNMLIDIHADWTGLIHKHTHTHSLSAFLLIFFTISPSLPHTQTHTHTHIGVLFVKSPKHHLSLVPSFCHALQRCREKWCACETAYIMCRNVFPMGWNILVWKWKAGLQDAMLRGGSAITFYLPGALS